MNTIGTSQHQDIANTLLANTKLANTQNLAKPSASMQTSSVPAIPDEVLTLFVNMIREMLNLPDQRPRTDSGFSLDFPLLPTYRDGENAGEGFFFDLAPLPTMNRRADDLSSPSFNMEMPSLKGSKDTEGANGAKGSAGLDGAGATQSKGVGVLSSSEGSILNRPPLPSFTGSITSSLSTPSTGNESSERTLKVAPLPSLVSSTGSLSTTELPKAFNPPAIPDLLGGNVGLPTVNAGGADNTPVATSLSTTSAGSGSTGRTLNVAPLPSLVSPTTGSLSTAELPKAFNPPAVPSLLGSSTSLPTVNAAAGESVPVATGQSTTIEGGDSTDQTLNVAPLPSLVSPTTGSLSTAELPKAFNPPAIPSLLGNSTILPSVNATENSALNTAQNESNTNNVNTSSIFAIPSLLGSGGTAGLGSLGLSGITVPSLTGNSTLSALSSAEGFSITGVSGIVDNSGSNTNDSNRQRTNHFK